MADLGQGQKPVVMPNYPHMMPEDREVWSKFLAAEGHRMKKVWYDLHVGQSVLLPEGSTQTDQAIAHGLTRKRIDVVAQAGGGFWVIEVKPKANMYALGQVLTYARLFREEYEHFGDVVPVVVCDEIDEDVRDDFDSMGVLVFRN